MEGFEKKEIPFAVHRRYGSDDCCRTFTNSMERTCAGYLLNSFFAAGGQGNNYYSCQCTIVRIIICSN